MEITVIKELINAFSEAELTELSLKCEAFELKLGKEVAAPLSAPIIQPVAAMQSTVYNEPLEGEMRKVEPTKTLGTKVITSPMVGTFYASTSPTAKSLVEIGSKVKKGDVVCVVEAMKLMNEVEADEEGEVVEILVNNEEMVEYAQPLFVLK